MKRELNLDIPGSVAEFELLLKRVLPRNILYQLVYGNGVEFDGYREFTQNDDGANIDWKASVRSQGLLVRKYIEERDLKIMFLVDVSDNMIFGSTEKLKCEYAAELIAALAHVMLIAGDRVGFVLFNDNIVKFRFPGFGDKQFNVLSHELSNALNYGGGSDLNNVLENLLGTLNKDTSMVFLVSDFVILNETNKKNLELFSVLFETIALIIKDPLDLTLPNVNKELAIENPRTGERLIINPKIAKEAYEVNAAQQTELIKDIFRESNIDFAEFNSKEHFALNLAQFLTERVKRRVYKKKDVH